MKKYVAICATLTALAWVGVAASAAPQGKLTGSASAGGTSLPTVTTPVIDGGTSYVGLGNDRSGTCEGDSGVVQRFSNTYNIVCAHYVASSRDGSGPKMRFAYVWFHPIAHWWIVEVWRVTDGGAGPDTVALGSDVSDFEATARQIAMQWVNTGRIGSGHPGAWLFQTPTSSSYAITASQT